MTPTADRIGRRLAEPVPAEIEAICAAMRERFGESLAAVIYYGSCLRQGDPRDGVVDVYVIVSDYARAFAGWKTRLLARFLPPTVGYLETGTPKGEVRAKYAVITLRDFRRGTSRRWFHSYLWGRFAQPCVLAYAQDDTTRSAVAACLETAVRTLLGRTVPIAPPQIDAAGLWTLALNLSYGAELRPESSGRGGELVEADRGYYEGLLTDLVRAAAVPGVSRGSGDQLVYTVDVSNWRRLTGRIGWALRRGLGKLLSIARWLKALWTFEGGLDYAIWKLERHSGTKIEVSERTRRRPWLHVWGELIRLYRQGVLR